VFSSACAAAKFRFKLLCLGCKTFSLRHGQSKVFFRVINLKPPEVLIDSDGSLLDVCDQVSHGTVGFQ